MSPVSNSQRPSAIRTRIKTPEKRNRQPHREPQRPSAIRTRIKTNRYHLLARKVQLRDHLPLEQGLRPVFVYSSSGSLNSQRPSAIRTRIKTLSPMRRRLPPRAQRPSAIRTRIKTSASMSHTRSGTAQRPSAIRTRIKTSVVIDDGVLQRHLRDHLPLEQGLRP